jgi:hypothetical protein
MPSTAARASLLRRETVAAGLNYKQIQQLWISAGGAKSAAPLMAAVALAESSGNNSDLNNNPSTGDYSVGLWQINYYGALNAPRTARYGTPAQLQADPLANAKAAVDLYAGGSGLSNWQNDWAAKAYAAGGMPAVTAAVDKYYGGKLLSGAETPAQVTAATGQSASSGNNSVTNIGSDVTGALGLPSISSSSVTSWLVRGGQLVAGFILAFAGVYLLARQVGLAPDPSMAPGPVGMVAGAVE